MENVVIKQFNDVYRGRRVFLTGHTGFKGSWLAAWLSRLGAEVTGYGLAPHTTPSHWDLLRLPARDIRGDVRDADALRQAVRTSRPEIVFHLAAQPLVRRSYGYPLETWSANVMGTANLLDACRDVDGLRAIVVITTDKVYTNREWTWGYRETDTLGGHDPYSASKAACEIVVSSYRSSFFSADDQPLIATARAGNLIGGGDWSEDRLIPDVVRALGAGRPVEIRSPEATRCWLHVLDCLAGYLMLGQHLYSGRRDVADAWNFGSSADDNQTVDGVLNMLRSGWPDLQWYSPNENRPH
ncbi:MAG TPA: CDP-glucose 4,6-dehydratase, partial [Terriglobia bacterium]|nr:CDP-glucose 4,6-dehydratase [Terriglobia bacterium]